MGLEDKSVFVVEDDWDIRKKIRSLLELENASVTIARNGREASDYIQGDLFYDVLITDFSLPDTDGSEIASESRRKHPSTPIILLSESGLYDFSYKPDGVSTVVTKKPYGDKKDFDSRTLLNALHHFVH